MGWKAAQVSLSVPVTVVVAETPMPYIPTITRTILVGNVASGDGWAGYKLPADADAPVGFEFIATGKGTGGFRIAQFASQTIHDTCSASQTTVGTGGYVAGAQGVVARVVKSAANTWYLIPLIGTPTYA